MALEDFLINGTPAVIAVVLFYFLMRDELRQLAKAVEALSRTIMSEEIELRTISSHTNKDKKLIEKLKESIEKHDTKAD